MNKITMFQISIMVVLSQLEPLKMLTAMAVLKQTLCQLQTAMGPLLLTLLVTAATTLPPPPLSLLWRATVSPWVTPSPAPILCHRRESASTLLSNTTLTQ